MQISSVQSYNSQTKINKSNSFKSLKMAPDFSYSELFAHIDSAGIESITQRFANMANATFNLREIVKLEEPTAQREKMLKRLFDNIDAKEINNFTVRIVPFLKRWNPSESFNISVYDNGVDFKIDLPDNEEVTIDSVSWTSGTGRSNRNQFNTPTAINCRYRKQNYDNGYDLMKVPIEFNPNGRPILDGFFYAIPTVETIYKNISKAINEKIDRMVTNENAVVESVNKEDALSKLAKLAQKTDNNGMNSAKVIEVHEEDILSVDSAICTLEDINSYIIEHAAEIDYGRIFNKPVTKDGESLLIALAHVIPSADNTDMYMKLVKSMHKMPLIDYNQKDKMGLPAIVHVMNSQNKLLFAAFCNCKELKYEPSFEFDFNNINDAEFKSNILKSRIFENAQNVEYKTMLGMPNPLYNGQ